MKKFMLILIPDSGEPFAKFYNTYNEAHEASMNAECGLGWRFQLYEYDPYGEHDGYVLIEE